MAGSSIAGSDVGGGGGDSLYGPSPPSSPVPEFEDLGPQDPETEAAGTQVAEPAQSGSQEPESPDIQSQEPGVEPKDTQLLTPETEVIESQGSDHPASDPQDIDAQDPEPKSVDPEPVESHTADSQAADSQTASAEAPKTESVDPEVSKTDFVNPESIVKVSSPKSPIPPIPTPTDPATTALMALVPEDGNLNSPKNSPVVATKSINTRQQKRETKQREEERKQAESLRIQEESIQILRQQLKLGRLAICVGSGVTLYSASTQTSRLSWWGLMANALDYFEDQASGLTKNSIKKADLNSARRILLKKDLTEADREDVTNRIQKLLASRVDLETTWMRAQFQNLYRDYVDQLEILDAIKLLQQQGAILFTTNYDDLLEKHCNLEPIDASDPNGLISFRRGSRPAVFHPHGYWRNAKHIVLSAEQYWRVKNDQVVQETLQHILATKTVLFVGCGGGLADPNFGSLINWIGERNIGTGSSHYILLRKQEKNPVTELPLIHLRCEAFDDIPRYLKNILDPSERREGSLYELPWDRERRRIHDWLNPADQSEFLNDMINLHGPNRFDRQVTNSQDVWSLNTPSRVRVKGGEGFGKTMFCASVIHHTLKACRLPAFRRTRDSLAYFFCATYKPYINQPEVHLHDFNLFLRTIVSQLCPPETVFESLRVLYTDCTRYHPARLPTNEELQKVFIQAIQDFDRPPSPRGGDPVMPGETYLVIDELETLSVNMQSEYSKFIRTITSLQLEHFHLLVTAENSLAVGLAPPARPVKAPRGRKAKARSETLGLSEITAVSTASWAEVDLNWQSTGTAAMEWLRDRFANDPALANYVNIRQDIMFQIHGSGENLRWIYWKLNRLGKIGARQDLNDKDLKQLAEAALEEDSEVEVEGEEEEEDGLENDYDDDDDKGLAAVGAKRRKKQSSSPVKKRSTSPFT